MEGVLVILERLLLLGVAIFAIYQSFEIEDRGWLARPAAGWTVRISHRRRRGLSVHYGTTGGDPLTSLKKNSSTFRKRARAFVATCAKC